MNELHGNLHKISDDSFKKLVNYFATNTLTLRDHYSLLNEITGPKAMSKALKLPA
jgi:hypothetical protein